MKSENAPYPYPVLAATDLSNNYSSEHFRFAIERCREVLARCTAEDNSSDQQIARVRILKHLDVQLSRASDWADSDADLIAGVMRNLIELKFWANFVSEDPKNATRFIHEAYIDARELFEKLEELVPPYTYQINPSMFLQGKRVNVEPSGAKEALIWKMCSKLIHPSSWVINDPEDSIHNPLQREVMAVYVVFYGWGIIRTFHHIEWT